MVVGTSPPPSTYSYKPRQYRPDKSQIENHDYKKVKYYGIGYDKFTDKSIVSFTNTLGSKAEFLIGGSIMSLSAEFRFTGKNLSESVEEFTLSIIGYGKSPQFLNNRRLYIIADEARFDLGDGGFGIKDNVVLGRQIDERIDFKISRKDLEKIATAKSVELKIAESIFTVKPEIPEGIRNVIAFGTVK